MCNLLSPCRDSQHYYGDVCKVVAPGLRKDVSALECAMLRHAFQYQRIVCSACPHTHLLHIYTHTLYFSLQHWYLPDYGCTKIQACCLDYALSPNRKIYWSCLLVHPSNKCIYMRKLSYSVYRRGNSKQRLSSCVRFLKSVAGEIRVEPRRYSSRALGLARRHVDIAPVTVGIIARDELAIMMHGHWLHINGTIWIPLVIFLGQCVFVIDVANKLVTHAYYLVTTC